VVADETRGRRVKAWVESPEGRIYLRKLPLDVRPYELAIEHFALRAAEACGLAVAESTPCIWTTSAGTEQKGIASASFVRSDEELSSGSQVLAGFSSAYNPTEYSHHSPEAVRNALSARSPQLIPQFLQMVIFDAWIGNADRHQENWGILTSAAGDRLTPLYDPAACLGAELQDRHGLLDPACGEERIRSYVEKCPSGFGNGATLIALSAALELFRAWPEWSSAAVPMLVRFEDAREPMFSYLDGIPEEWLPEKRKLLAKRLLDRRLTWLREKCTS
jgi:hypothetical protein